MAEVANMPGIKGSPLWQVLLDPAISAGAKLDDPKQVFASTISAIKAKQIDVGVAASDLAYLYQKGVETNLQSKQLTKFGLVPSRSYNTSIQTNSSAFFGGSEIVNMADPNAVKRAIMKALSPERMPSLEVR
jgi:hypothetical protein